MKRLRSSLAEVFVSFLGGGKGRKLVAEKSGGEVRF